jgi:hypothetical protein
MNPNTGPTPASRFPKCLKQAFQVLALARTTVPELPAYMYTSRITLKYVLSSIGLRPTGQ